MATCVCPIPRTECPHCEFACEACVDAFNTHPRSGDVYHNDGIGEVTLTARNKRNDGWTTNNPAVELMDSGFASGHHKLVKAGAAPALDKGAKAADALHAKRDQARSDLATERARSAGLTRALEEIKQRWQTPDGRWCTLCDHCICTDDCPVSIASRALTAIGAVTGGGAAAGRIADLEKALDDVMKQRDDFEEFIGELAADFGCKDEWSSLHTHLDCLREAAARSQPGGTPGAGEAPGGWLTFNDLHVANKARCQDPKMEGGFDEPLNGMGWTAVEWSAAIAEEAGEICAVALGISGLKGSKSTKTVQDMADEVADLVITADLMATRIGRTLGSCVEDKFNRVSEKRGSKHRLPSHAPAAPATPVTQRRPAGCRARLNAAFLCGDVAGDRRVLCVDCQVEADRRGKP